MYCVRINNVIQKQSWGFTYRDVSNALDKAPKQMEVIKNPHYIIVLGLENDRSISQFDDFTYAIKNGNAIYEPVLGIHNCPAQLYFLQEGELTAKEYSTFESNAFVSSKHKPILDNSNIFRMGFDKIPTFQNEDFWNLPDKYVHVIYPSDSKTLKVEGTHHEFSDNTKWFMI